jgi:succinate dehydrogenase / fumarate reductase membrane anchor subunit
MAATLEDLEHRESAHRQADRAKVVRRYSTRQQIPRSEAISWFFMRVSGLFLIFLALGHFLIMHMINDVRDTTFDFVVQRWGNPFWRVWDWLLLALGLLHGTNGVKTVLEDNISSRGALLAAKTVLYSVAVLAFVVGTVILVTFGSLIPR